MHSRLTCRELVGFLADYLDGQLSPALLAAFNVHLARCPCCVNYTRTYRQTVRRGRDAYLCPDDRVPAGVPEDLIRAILAAREESA